MSNLEIITLLAFSEEGKNFISPSLSLTIGQTAITGMIGRVNITEE